MSHKQVLFRSAAREKILRGAVASVLLLTEATMTKVAEKKTDAALEPDMAA
jgi:hypothetical protein